MKFPLVLLCLVTCSAAPIKYKVNCPKGSKISIKAPRVMSTYKDFKESVCAACGVVDCKDTRLFEGNRMKSDRDRVMSGSLECLSLKNYGSDAMDVFYKCTRGFAVKKIQCYTSFTLNECLVSQCGECKKSNKCKVYAGAKRVSSGKVTLSRGIYQVGTKTSKLEKVKHILDKIKKLVTSGKAKGVASAIGATVIHDKYKILKLAKVVGLPEKTTKSTDEIIRLGDSVYVQDFSGGLKTLVDVIGRPLSVEEELVIGGDMDDCEIDYVKLLAIVEAEWDDVRRGKDLYQDDHRLHGSWDRYNVHILVGGVVIALVFLLMGFCICMKRTSSRPLRHQ